MFSSEQPIPTMKLFDKLIFNSETILEHLKTHFKDTIYSQFVEVNKIVSSANWWCVIASPLLWALNPLIKPMAFNFVRRELYHYGE